MLWFYEASAVLAREQNRGTLAAPKADEFIAELKALRIAVDAESAARVFNGVHRLALDHRLTSYGQGGDHGLEHAGNSANLVNSWQVVQAVGERVERYYDRPWRTGEELQGSLVVIGQRGLDSAAIRAVILADAAA